MLTADGNGDKNKEETRELTWPGDDCPAAAPQEAPSPHCVPYKALGPLLPPLSGVPPAQDDLTLSLPLGRCCHGALKVPRSIKILRHRFVG